MEPPEKPASLKQPLLLNLGLVLVLALLAHWVASGNAPNHQDEGEAALLLFFLLLGQLGLNGLLVLISLLTGNKHRVRGLLLASLLVLLIGLGTCGYSLEHLHFSTR